MTAVSGVYARRRARFLKSLGNDGVAILPTNEESSRNGDAHYPFRVASNFFYLTGFSEPGALAVFIGGTSAAKQGFILFCRDKDPEKEIWDGYRAGQEGAVAVYGATAAFSIDEIDERIPELLLGRSRLYLPMTSADGWRSQIMDWLSEAGTKIRSGASVPAECVAIESILHEMRLRKDREEISAMRKAAQISAAAHCLAMKKCQPGVYEYELEAELIYEFKRNGADAPAYSSIVGGGANACVLHYIENKSVLKNGDLVLIDAGAEWGTYAADITRTFPVNGRFSPAQGAIYEIVLKAQEAAIAKIRPGVAWNVPHDTAVKILTQGLVALRLLKGEIKELIKKEAYRRFYMHKTGHWLGLDVHDVGEYRVNGKWRKFEPGMVLTVEPGLYIPENSKGIAKKWWNIGIRIEDDVLVTRKGCDVLSRGVPKKIVEIERLMGSAG
ncbi:Xaa-Pro aminopeptidase [hydrothermal vent metagenome]|uniref:Xaa-Pro aminopeptidase n=1 Tax=hydrothermal vent metagenome TaxID=652676 RepID=A0A3B0ZA40_9ZZZZ